MVTIKSHGQTGARTRVFPNVTGSQSTTKLTDTTRRLVKGNCYTDMSRYLLYERTINKFLIRLGDTTARCKLSPPLSTLIPKRKKTILLVKREGCLLKACQVGGELRVLINAWLMIYIQLRIKYQTIQSISQNGQAYCRNIHRQMFKNYIKNYLSISGYLTILSGICELSSTRLL